MAYSNYDVCHAWAHNEDRAHYGSSISHENGVLKSYSTCIGQRLEINGKVIFIVDTNRYSNSTSKHQSNMMGAIPHGIENVEEFHVPNADWGRWRFISTHYSKEELQTEITILGLNMLMESLETCLGLQTCKKLQHGFSDHGYKEMVRLFEATGVTSVRKLLRLKAEDRSRLMRRAARNVCCNDMVDVVANTGLKFLKLMSEGAELSTIVDAVNGKGTWEAYQQRISGLKIAEKNRRLSDFLAYDSARQCFFSTYAGRHGAYVTGSITKKDYEKHVKAGDLISWMLKVRRRNLEKAAQAYEARQKHDRYEKAKRHLEVYIGLNGFEHRYSPWRGNDKRAFTSFNYNGTVIDFTGRNDYQERFLSKEEYAEYVASSNKAEWIRNKRQWMLARLQHDQYMYETREARWAEEERLRKLEREQYERLEAEKKDYIAELKAKGDEGYRQLYHEGFRVSLPYNNDTVFYGGNVLLKVNTTRNIVETSKGIKLSFDECKRLWVIFSRWHDSQNGCEKGLVIKTLGSEYRVHSFANDILTARCHQIAYREMQYIAHELGFVA